MWLAIAEYKDGTRIEKRFAYNENDNYTRECNRQWELECWLLEQHDDCTYYSVSYEPEEEELEL